MMKAGLMKKKMVGQTRSNKMADEVLESKATETEEAMVDKPVEQEGKEAEAIREFAKRENKKILSLGFYQPFCDEYVLASPLEVLVYIKYADYVITDTFHGTVFSIKYQKKFGTIIRDSNRQKLGDLMQRFGVMERQICELEGLRQIMVSELDKEKVKNILFATQKAGRAYLKENV